MPKKSSRTSERSTRNPKPAAPQKPPGKPVGYIPLGAEQLKKFYARMLRCRIVGDRLNAAFPNAANSSRWMEAIAVGTSMQLRPDDVIAPGPYDGLIMLAMNRPLRKVLPLWQLRDAKQELVAREVSRDTVHPPSECGSQFGIGTGLALALRQQKLDKVVLTTACGWEQTAEFGSTIQFAAANKLGILFVLAEDKPRKSPQKANSDFAVRELAHAAGMPGVTVDANDVVAVYRVAQESIHRGRAGDGPTLMDCRKLEDRDPLVNMEDYLRQYSLWSDEWKTQLTAECDRELREAGVR
jgi:TPP-dependent pyruvate/acetoin dehydrogenase alpha subunit